MDINKPLFWHQGLFLQPQHLQLADLNQFYRTRAFREYGLPYFWGVIKLGFREGALERQIVEITEAEVLFHQGQHLCFPGNTILEPRSFEKDWPDRERPLTVYLGLRRWNEEGGNVTVVSEGSAIGINTQLMALPDPVEVPDQFGNGPVAQVKQMHFVLRLFWETELDGSEGYDLIPIARLKMEGEKISFDQDFVPPCLTISASDLLIQIFRDIHDQIITRCQKLEEYKNPGVLADDKNEVWIQDSTMPFVLALQTLNRYVPAVRHLLKIPHVHPWLVYGQLCQLYGELSLFASDLSALGENREGEKLLPDYDHKDLGHCFTAVQSLISRILDSLTSGPEFMEQFTYDQPYFTIQLPAKAFVTEGSYWLLVKTDDPETAREELPRLAKLSATKGMSLLLAKAVSGIGLTFFKNPPPGLPRSKSTLFFRIDSQSPLWNEVLSSGSLSLYWHTASEDITIYFATLKG